MGRKVDVSNLTEDEAEHVLQVVQRDMQLRKTEEERLSELKQELDQEESRCVLLSRQRGFNERCCIRCCSSFTFLLKPRHRCQDCRYNVCKRCCSYSKTDKSWLCSACERSRLLKTQSLEWFYSNVRRRFKRFGSAKVLKMLYRRHVGEQASQAELTEESLYAESLGTVDSMYESDSTFYKHSEECSMAETISVALRVAKEAIDEAITKAECQTDNQAKQKEACYLRENKGELIEELTTMIVQTIICKKRDLSEMQPECDLESAADQNTNKSRSAMSLLTEEIMAQQDKAESSSILCSQGQKKDVVPVPTVPNWNKNVEWLESSCKSTSSVLQSPDGNWFALQNTQPSRLSLPNKRENLMFSALDKESGVLSAYDGMVSDAESDTDGDWTSAWLELHHKMSSINLINDGQTTSSEVTMKSPTQIIKDQTRDDTMSQIHRPSLSFQQHRLLSAQGFNVNTDGTDSSEDDLEDSSFKRTRRRRISKRENAEELPISETENYGRMLVDVLLKSQNKKLGVSEFLDDQTSTDMPDSLTPDILRSGTITPDDFATEELTSTLRELTSQVNETVPTRNYHDRAEASMDEINENRESTGKDRERVEIVHLKDMQVNVHQNDSREILYIEKNSVQMVNLTEENRGCSGKVEQEVTEPDVKNCKNGDMALLKAENVYVEMSSNLHDCETKITTEFRENGTIVVDSFDDIPLEGQIKMHIDSSCSESEESNANEKNKEHDTNSGPNQNPLNSKTYKEPNTQSILEVDGQSPGESILKVDGQSPGESILRAVEIDSRKWEKQRQDTRNTAESEDKTEETIQRQIKRLGDNYDQHDFTKEAFRTEVEYERMTNSVEKAADNIKEEMEVPVSNIRSNISDVPHSVSEGTDEAQEQDSTEGKQMKDHTEQYEVPNEKDSSHALDDETEEEGCEVQGDCDDILFKEVLPSTMSGQERYLSPEEIYKKYSAASLRSITTEVLKVLNATEDLIHGSMGHSQSESQDRQVLSPSQSKKLEEQLSKLEENVYVAASAVFGLEAELGDLEQCARSLSGATTEEELTHLEEQVASAAAQVQQSDLQVSDIAARIAALKSAGLNVAPQTRFAKLQTIDTCRQRRRRLPVPPMPGKKA